MRTIQYVRAGCLVSTLAAAFLMAGSARADVSTERPGSLLIFPKVVQADGRETIIQITNTGNSVDNLHCFYIDGSLGPNGHPVCRVTDFALTLTRQQPTHWDVSTGRPVNPTDSIEGFDPGLIPPVAPGFAGALVCAEVDADGTPIAANKIKGEATLEGPNGDIAKYNGAAIQGTSESTAPGTENVLSLNNVEYNACSEASIFNFLPDNGTDPVIEALGNGGTCSGGTRPGGACNNSGDCFGGTCITGQSRVANSITVLPCNLDLRTQTPSRFSLNYLVVDEDETTTSGSISPLECWASIPLADLQNTDAGSLAGSYASLRIRAGTGGPVIAVGETFHVDSVGNTGATAVNLHMTGVCQAPAAQAPDLHFLCQSTADCPETWTCVSSHSSTITLPTLVP